MIGKNPNISSCIATRTVQPIELLYSVSKSDQEKNTYSTLFNIVNHLNEIKNHQRTHIHKSAWHESHCVIVLFMTQISCYNILLFTACWIPTVFFSLHFLLSSFLSGFKIDKFKIKIFYWWACLFFLRFGLFTCCISFFLGFIPLWHYDRCGVNEMCLLIRKIVSIN